MYFISSKIPPSDLTIEQDANLKRCFGKPEKIIDCDWEYIQSLRTIAEPHVPMPRLKELLEYLATPGLEDLWLLLDIKVLDFQSAPYPDLTRISSSTMTQTMSSASLPQISHPFLSHQAPNPGISASSSDSGPLNT